MLNKGEAVDHLIDGAKKEKIGEDVQQQIKSNIYTYDDAKNEQRNI